MTGESHQNAKWRGFGVGLRLTSMKLHTDEIEGGAGGGDLPVDQHDIEMAVLAFLHGAVSH